MLIILEGPPGVGKSDLAEALCEEIIRRHPEDAVEIRRQGITLAHPLDTYVLPLLDYRPHRESFRRESDGAMVRRPGRHVICDGWHWGETVYSSVFGRPTQMTLPVLRYIELFLASRGAYLVNLFRDAEDLADIATERGYGSPAPPWVAMQRTIAGYLSVMHLSTLRTQDLHVESDGVVSEILATARAREVGAGMVENLTTYVGPPNADTLILGNARGSIADHELSPAFMPYPSSCGVYLMEALEYVSFGNSAHGYGIANARDVDALEEILESLSPRRIVTLGKRTYDVVRPEFRRVCEVGHPARMRGLWGSLNPSEWAVVIQHTTQELDRSHGQA